MNKNAEPNVIAITDYTPSSFLIEAVHLRFELGEEETRVVSQLNIVRNPNGPAVNILSLQGEKLRLGSLKWDGEPIPASQYRVTASTLDIHDVPDRFLLEVETWIRPQENTELEGLYKSSGNFCTQCEAEGFRRITYFLDRPDVMACYTVEIVADQATYPVLLSNGNLIKNETLEGGKHTAIWHDPFPKPSYLFALVAGDLASIADRYKTASGRDVELKIYVEPHNIDKCDYAMTSLKKSMAWDEEVFGLEYDLNIYMIVAVDDFNMGAMENKGLNVFNSKFVLADQASATDSDFMGIEGVIGHEYFHNWTGNRVTCRDWFQLSLKEGLTVFRDQEFSADMNARGVKRIEDVRLLRQRQFAEDASPMAHPIRPKRYIEINNFYTVTVYEKGAEVIRMMHTLLGKEGFRKGMDCYFERHDGEAATCDNFRLAMQDASGVDLTQFEQWYEQAGTPELHIDSEYDAEKAVYRLQIRQSNLTHEGSKQPPLHIPLRIALLDRQGQMIPLQLSDEAESTASERVLDITQELQRFTFINVPNEPVPSLLRGFSAPVKLFFDYSMEDLSFLVMHESDDFNRWEACQQLATRYMLQLAAEYQRNDAFTFPSIYVDAVGKLLVSTQDVALLAETIQLPSEEVVAEYMPTADLDALYAAREHMKQALLDAHYTQLVDWYQRLAPTGAYQPIASEIGRRGLRNACLSYLCSGDDATWLAEALQQFKQADNMTDSAAAVSILLNSDADARHDVIADFYTRWKGQRLVIDKWFTLQATAKRADTLTTVKALMQHADFDLNNPNRARSLIGAFCIGNPLRFHQADGEGYEFLADNVLALDAINPQIAARMVSPLIRWSRFDAARQALMKAQLKRILATQGLSNGVQEIVMKGLEETA